MQNLTALEDVELSSNDNIECIKVVNESDVSDSRLILEAYPNIKEKLTTLNEKESQLRLFSFLSRDDIFII